MQGIGLAAGVLLLRQAMAGASQRRVPALEVLAAGAAVAGAARELAKCARGRLGLTLFLTALIWHGDVARGASEACMGSGAEPSWGSKQGWLGVEKRLGIDAA